MILLYGNYLKHEEIFLHALAGSFSGFGHLLTLLLPLRNIDGFAIRLLCCPCIASWQMAGRSRNFSPTQSGCEFFPFTCRTIGVLSVVSGFSLSLGHT